ncbi:MAG: hypothetical protein ACKO37_05290 [Vampirovibrionales bacterium]
MVRAFIERVFRHSVLIGILLGYWGSIEDTIQVHAAQRVGSPYLDKACGLDEKVFYHSVWDGFLIRVIDPETQHVDLPYAKVQLAQLTGYLDQVAKLSPYNAPACFPTKQHQWAYWLNVYNAQALRMALMRFPAINGQLALSDTHLEGMQHQGFWVGGKVDSLHNIWERELQPAMAYLGPEVFWCLNTHGAAQGRLSTLRAFDASSTEPPLRKQVKAHAKQVWLSVITPQQDALMVPNAPLKLPSFWIAQAPWVNEYLTAHPELGLPDFTAYAWHYVPSNVYKQRPKNSKTPWRIEGYSQGIRSEV